MERRSFITTTAVACPVRARVVPRQSGGGQFVPELVDDARKPHVREGLAVDHEVAVRLRPVDARPDDVVIPWRDAPFRDGWQERAERRPVGLIPMRAYGQDATT